MNLPVTLLLLLFSPGRPLTGTVRSQPRGARGPDRCCRNLEESSRAEKFNTLPRAAPEVGYKSNIMRRAQSRQLGAVLQQMWYRFRGTPTVATCGVNRLVYTVLVGPQ